MPSCLEDGGGALNAKAGKRLTVKELSFEGKATPAFVSSLGKLHLQVAKVWKQPASLSDWPDVQPNGMTCEGAAQLAQLADARCILLCFTLPEEHAQPLS